MAQRYDADHLPHGEGEDSSEYLTDIQADDVLISALARGEDPTGGTDPLAGLLLGLREEVTAASPAPTLTELGLDDDSFPATNVISLDKRRRGWSGRIASGLVGAAAATLMITGSATMIYNADENSALYGLKQQIFTGTDREAVVQLASALEEANSRNESGDVEGAKAAIERAQAAVEKLNERAMPAIEKSGDKAQDSEQRSVQETGPSVVTTTVTEPAETVTHTVAPSDVVVTVTQTVAPPVPSTSNSAVAPVQTATSTSATEPESPNDQLPIQIPDLGGR
ncbi:Uncharacterised protein [Corynebacterium kutscheri]|uniref:Anti-sigma-D factor RsdA sigma factor binding region domain-containing protein n=1 Tax=Corynebacterium kutscheri TaxID=35755 RepID=A0A0F6TCF0_9CORY|nr:hypothetical protein [Corynebacterium kutscheri]AKE40631.1 hypothetical protein UL82_02030 [Corynebacterium kutscheri]VEH11028.1 Uncharacterised protein [Corynebacterium kutscheri]VEH80493.1 Uncharacterised protein [Corynebacterium kutscheri]